MVPMNLMNDREIDREKIIEKWPGLECSNSRYKYFNKIKTKKTLNQLVTDEAENVSSKGDCFSRPIYLWSHVLCAQLIAESKKAINMPIGLAGIDIKRFITTCDICGETDGATINCTNGKH